jgi:AraC-like DNA-binding protein/quercetin dioxygenase-like cupin family protein
MIAVLIGSVEVLWVARFDYEPGWVLKGHRHDYYQLLYIIDGKGRCEVDGRIEPISKGEVFLFSPDKPHGLVPIGDSAVKTLDIKFLVSDSEIRLMLDSIHPERISGLSFVRELLEKIREEGASRALFYKELCNLYLTQVIIALLRNSMSLSHTEETSLATDSSSGDMVCEAFISYVKDHYDDHLELGEIARSIGYHQSYICQRFKEVYGQSPMRFVYEYRLDRAKDFMLYSDCFNLEQVALKTGFKTVNHFCRLFKKYVGMTPRQYWDREVEGIRKEIYLSRSFYNHMHVETGSSVRRPRLRLTC